MENMKREVIIRNGDGDDDDDDEMKMEKFYSLLRSFRDARDRRRRELQDLERNENESKKKMKVITTTSFQPKQEAASFEWQDFTTEIHFRKPPSIFPDPVPGDTITIKDNKGKRKDQHHTDSLDLNLAL